MHGQQNDKYTEMHGQQNVKKREQSYQWGFYSSWLRNDGVWGTAAKYNR